jgi:hypothetical protein
MAYSKKLDKMYKAIGKGERTSSKFATIRMTDGTTFKRKNANQYGAAEGGNDYTENRVNRTDVYPKDSRKKIMKTGGGVGRSSWAKATDNMYKAIGKGERTSSKFATIRKSDGTSFKRKNANQYGAAEGGNDYVENRVNRTDAYPKDARKKIMADGGPVGNTPEVFPTNDAFSFKNGGKMKKAPMKKAKARKLPEPKIIRGFSDDEGYEYGMGGTMECCYSIGGL